MRGSARTYLCGAAEFIPPRGWARCSGELYLAAKHPCRRTFARATKWFGERHDDMRMSGIRAMASKASRGSSYAEAAASSMQTKKREPALRWGGANRNRLSACC